jgi:drug/metabolite transporter (DMT)-like permease
MGYSVVEDVSLYKKHYLVLFYVALFPSVLSYYFWHQGIKEIGANKTGQFTHLMPLFGSLLAYIFLGEQLSFYHIIGAIFIGLGIYLSLFIGKEKK